MVRVSSSSENDDSRPITCRMKKFADRTTHGRSSWSRSVEAKENFGLRAAPTRLIGASVLANGNGAVPSAPAERAMRCRTFEPQPEVIRAT